MTAMGLKVLLQEESISVDDELERQVAAEAAALEQLEIEESRKVCQDLFVFFYYMV